MSIDLDNLGEEYDSKYLFKNSLQNLKKLEEFEKVIIIYNLLIRNENNFNKVLDKTINDDFYNSNTKINLKLKLNIREFLIINHCPYPPYIKIN